MNLADNNDYFLHDFSSQQAGASADRTPEAGQNVDFTPGSEPKQPQPRRNRGCLRFWLWFFTIMAIILGITFYIRYLTPHTTDARITGYVTSVERRGIMFKTFEGEMISLTAIHDSTRIYQHDITFSIPNDSVARTLQRYQGTGQPVTVTLEKYYGTLPWRGASTTVAVAVAPATASPETP